MSAFFSCKILESKRSLSHTHTHCLSPTLHRSLCRSFTKAQTFCIIYDSIKSSLPFHFRFCFSLCRNSHTYTYTYIHTGASCIYLFCGVFFFGSRVIVNEISQLNGKHPENCYLFLDFFLLLLIQSSGTFELSTFT